jgi:type IV secretory pathway VirB10-like protein
MSQATTFKLSWRAPLLMGLLLASSSVAMAQWQWIDGTGRKVFSDTPPPASIPDKNIVRKPGAGMAPPAVSAEPVAAVTAPAAPAAPQIPARDTELEAKKKQAEQAEEAKKKTEMERLVKARADSCERARKAKITMDSGVRLATTNAKGEREIMDDKARAAEAQRMEGIIRSDCGPLPKQ